MLLMGASRDDSLTARDTLIYLLQNLVFQCSEISTESNVDFGISRIVSEFPGYNIQKQEVKLFTSY